MPVCYQNHWTLYVINKNYEQIDILDSLANKKYHYSIAGAVRTKLSAVISLVAKEHPDFSGWSLPSVPSLPQQEKSLDSAFCVMMFMRHYNPDSHKLEFFELGADWKSGELRIDNLWYLIHHKLNGSRDTLPEGIIQDHGSSP